MTYGWAILVVMIVGLAFWQLGILEPAGSGKSITGFSAGLKPADYAIFTNTAQTHCTVMLSLVNGEGQDVEIDSVSFVEVDGNTPNPNVYFVQEHQAGSCGKITCDVATGENIVVLVSAADGGINPVAHPLAGRTKAWHQIIPPAVCVKLV